HLVVHRPHADAVTRHLAFPVHRHGGTRIQDSDGDVLRQILEITDVDLLVFAQTITPHRWHVRHAVREQDDVDRRQHEVLPLHERADAPEERIEIRQAVVRGILLAEECRDLRHAEILERVNRLERFRLTRALAADRSDEHRGRPLQSTETMQTRVEVIGGEFDRVLVVLVERAADVDADDERGPRHAIRLRIRSARRERHSRGAQDQRGDREARLTAEARHDATLGISRGVEMPTPGIRSDRPERATPNGLDNSMSSSVLNGSGNAGLDCTTTTAKFTAAASSCSTGSVSSSNRRLPSCWNHATSALRASTGARHMSLVTGAGTAETPPSCVMV